MVTYFLKFLGVFSVQIRQDDAVRRRVLLDGGKIFRERELRTLDVLVHQTDHHAGLGNFGRIPAVRRQNHKVEERLLLGIQTRSGYNAALQNENAHAR